MKFRNAPILTFLLMLTILAQPALAGPSSQHSGESVRNSSLAIGYSGSMAVASVASVAAIPFAASISAGDTSKKTQYTQLANTPIGEPLPIGDQTFTAGPSPDKVIHSDGAVR